jgi:succinate dehydrogenase/fumarate reductase flavoprotein subunit
MASGTAYQRRAGIVDSPGQHESDLKVIAESAGVPDDANLRRLLAQSLPDAVAFLQSIGVDFIGPLPQPPHRLPRNLNVVPTSRAYIHHLHRRCRELGVDMRTGLRARGLVLFRGAVTGVDAEDGNGIRLRISARVGVILASGDISANPELMRRYFDVEPGGIEPYNPASTGDGQLMAAAVGARLVERRATNQASIRFDYLRFPPPPNETFLRKLPPWKWLTTAMVLAANTLPSSLLRPVMMRFLTTALGPDQGLFDHGAILVNRSGRRFTDESGAINDALAKQPGKCAYIVFDDRLAAKFSSWPHFVSTAPGVAYAYMGDYRKTRKDIFRQAGSIDSLAVTLGMEGKVLQETVNEVNAGRRDQAIVQPPFYALGPVKAWFLNTSIGVAVNERLEVLDMEGKAIPGLYAAGHAGQGGLAITGHGHGLGWAFASGRVAGRSAASRFKTHETNSAMQSMPEREPENA